MRGAISVFLCARTIFCLGQRTVDEAIFCIHDGCLTVHTCLLLDTGSSVVARRQHLLMILGTVLIENVALHKVRDLLIVLQKFNGKVTGGEVCGQVLVSLEETLDMRDSIFYFMAIVNMDVTRLRMTPLKNLDDGMKQLFDTRSVLEGGRHERHAEEGGEGVELDVVATPLELIVHIQGADDTQVHIYELRRQVEIALDIGGIDDINDNIRVLVGQVLPHIQLFRRVAREGIGAGKIGEVESVPLHLRCGCSGINGDTRIVAHAGMSATGKVEEGGLTTVGIADEGDRDRSGPSPLPLPCREGSRMI